MTKWDKYGIEERVLSILRDVPDSGEGHHLGRPFLTVYQIAIEFARRHPEIVEKLGYPVGGIGSGVRYSLATYLAKQLSDRIRDGRIPVEGGFVSNWHLNDISFTHEDKLIHSSLTASGFTLSMFRLHKS